MVDITVTITINGHLADLARTAPFLRDLDAQGVDYSVKLSAGDWEQVYANSKAWREASHSPLLDPPDAVS